MELSILIPIYRFDCSALLGALEAQCGAEGMEYEILTADDEQLHLGRARIRNHLADKATGRWLLFIDCDAAVDNAAFIHRYREAANEGSPVICGGLHHADHLPSPTVSLRYRYEKAADRHRSAAERSRTPYARFTPFNFLIQRDTFLSIRFNESCTGYGHEDTLFGAELERRGIAIQHIDNPLLHTGLEPNEVFLEKTREALRNLKQMESQLAGHSTLLKGYRLLRRFHLQGATAWLFRHRRTQWERRLTGSLKPSLRLFQIYKTGYYAQL